MNDYYSQCLRPGGSTTTAPTTSQPVDSGASIVATENKGAPEAPPPKTAEAAGPVAPAEIDEQPPDALAGGCPSPFEDLDPIYCKQTDTLVPGLTSQFCVDKVRIPTQVSVFNCRFPLPWFLLSAGALCSMQMALISKQLSTAAHINRAVTVAFHPLEV
jgi:hypothetical protein